ncbi:hypothetical protein [Bradyrhizobium sp. 188]|uniref:hypothetical protein n=1 Tax=Bradyrhizobium sp. 188 TaxID=2782656 RepID=UPI001FFA69C3|nr:hypothetical protein [Bradyrhizobium sp. 188]MCK1503339.1 hypothetical protein [Bradyrhizobium sp. 188]
MTISRKWAHVEARKALAIKLQRVWSDFVDTLVLGQSYAPSASLNTLTGLNGMPQLPMWNMQKA